MGQGLTDRFSGLSAGSARLTLATAAAFVVFAVSAILIASGVAGGEVDATLLFLPVFVLAMCGGRSFGYLGAAAATAVYVLVRFGDLQDAGAVAAVALVLARGGAYAVAAHIGLVARELTDTGADAPVPLPVDGRTRQAPGAARAPRPEPVAAMAGTRSEPALAAVGAAAMGGDAAWPPAGTGEERAMADDSWDAVQESWRQQHGVTQNEGGGRRDRAWPHEPQGEPVHDEA
jgi:hypothetical protein